jgi:hypothetical protein
MTDALIAGGSFTSASRRRSTPTMGQLDLAAARVTVAPGALTMAGLPIAKARALDELLEARLIERVAALEAQLARGAQPAPLKRANHVRVAQGARLRAAIAAILAAYEALGR